MLKIDELKRRSVEKQVKTSVIPENIKFEVNYPTEIAVNSYGGLKRGRRYQIVSELGDCLMVKYRGRPIYVPKYVFGK